MGANDPRGVANLDPRGMVGRIYVGDQQTLLDSKSVSSGIMVSEKKIFESSLAIQFYIKI